MLLFRHRGNLVSSVVDICMKCGSSNIIPLRISIALPRLKRISRVRFLVLLPLLVFRLHEDGPRSFDMATCTWYPRMTPDAENERGTAVLQLPLPSCTTNDVSAISRIMCLSSTVTGNDTIQPADPCDAHAQ